MQWVGVVVGSHQGVSTHRRTSGAHCCSEIPCWFGLESQDTQLPCVTTRRHSRSLGDGEAVYWQGKTYTLIFPFHHEG
ncbi:hypothetical protein Pmani_009055 [Petrolisthes manimaculis]|uniref:Uncharacterized protein n=1 Tax=Petrolisthes manimaculis TaxID=1843537 RepID=A0AAE1Q7S4_9EUCA|nr:hypothetical protein Pmani_009055 [Petrolisthes manimaculis]